VGGHRSIIDSGTASCDRLPGTGSCVVSRPAVSAVVAALTRYTRERQAELFIKDLDEDIMATRTLPRSSCFKASSLSFLLPLVFPSPWLIPRSTDMLHAAPLTHAALSSSASPMPLRSAAIQFFKNFSFSIQIIGDIRASPKTWNRGNRFHGQSCTAGGSSTGCKEASWSGGSHLRGADCIRAAVASPSGPEVGMHILLFPRLLLNSPAPPQNFSASSCSSQSRRQNEHIAPPDVLLTFTMRDCLPGPPQGVRRGRCVRSRRR
jgi:hypothetical protein